MDAFCVDKGSHNFRLHICNLHSMNRASSRLSHEKKCVLIKERGIADTDGADGAGDANSCFYLLDHHPSTCGVFFNKQYKCRVKFTVACSLKITIIFFSLISNYVKKFFNGAHNLLKVTCL